MAVPKEDIVCRFIRPGEWSKRENRPRPGAFKQVGLSVWHRERIQSTGATLEDLQFGSLEGSGTALLTVNQIFEAAETAERKRSGKLYVDVEWSPETVDNAWRQWKDAHAEVETRPSGESPEHAGGLMSAFRMELCLKAKCDPPPGPRGS